MVHLVPYSTADPTKLDAIRALVIKTDPTLPSNMWLYRCTLDNWPQLCFMAMDGEAIVGVVISTVQMHHNNMLRGGIMLLLVEKDYRSCGLGTRLVAQAVESLINADADEISVVTRTTNTNAIKIYEGLGFIRTKLLPNCGGGQSWRMMLLLGSLTEGLYDCSSEDYPETCGCGMLSGSVYSLSSCNSGCDHENDPHETSYRASSGIHDVE
ncbi:putative L-A virus GAG protein N-acetyltransferase [Morchella snyderi]|nr:putative L-A virus GAG protein N-acetyltransferase [Morchella snyderi]